MIRWATVLYLSKFQSLNPSFKQNGSVLYCYNLAGETQWSTRWLQIATYVPTSETKLPPLWNKNRETALISLGVKVKASSVIPVS